MTNKQQIKSSAKFAFDCKDHLSAFQILLRLESIDEFILYSEKENKEVNKSNWFCSEVFWNDFILRQPYFSELLNSELAIQLLHHYFKSYKECVPIFEKKVAKKFPELFIKAIRVNKVFLQDNRVDFLQKLELDEQFHIHQKAWTYFSVTEFNLWEQIQIEFERVKQLPFDEILCHCLIWLETYRFHKSTKYWSYHLSRVYNFFIEFLLSEYHLTVTNNLNADHLFNKFLNILNFNEGVCINSSVVKALELISKWVYLYEDIIIPYCFDMNFELVEENGKFLIKESQEANAKWKRGELRYEANKLYYNQFGYSMVNYLEKERGLIIPGSTKDSINTNRDALIKECATFSILKDIQHEYFLIGNQEVHAQKLLKPLIGFTSSKFDRYERSLDNIKLTSSNFPEAFLKLTDLAKRTDIQRDPFILLSESDYINLNRHVFEEDLEINTEDIIKLFSFQKKVEIQFDRFKQKYNVLNKPFVRIDNLLFSPTMFFANIDWFYSFTEVALRNLKISEQGQRSKAMEKYLFEKLKEKKFNVKLITDDEANQIDGDVDIFVEDNETLLYIQLKRTKFRLNPEDIYNEIINVDLKASTQLNNAERYLEQPNNIYEVKRKPIKWIISTSYENVNESINGCLKVNYFDLLYVLKSFEIKCLKDVVSLIENDVPLENYIELKKDKF